MSKIKICGLKTPRDASYVEEAGADYAGCILSRDPRFHRAIPPEQAKAIREVLPPQIPLVGVFVDDEPEYILELLLSDIIDIAQLHGKETPGMIRCLKELSAKPIWKAFQVRSAADVQEALDSPADNILLDGGTGTGTAFDWSLLTDLSRPYFLAGGLNPENLRQALEQIHPFGADISSGVETDKIKDRDKILAAVAIAHGR